MNPGSVSTAHSPIPAAASAWRRWRYAALIGLAVVVALNLAAFIVRARFVAVSGPYAATTGFEEFCLYNIWKAAHGFPVYEWPQRDHYLLSFYNGGFYYGSALWAKLWGASGPALVASTRFLPPFFALLGMLVQVHLLRRLGAGRDRRVGAWIWGLSFLTWFGTSFNAWTILSARPDVPAVALALAGFAVALHARESGRWWHWIASSLLFFAGWTFKQSAVWIFTGTVLYSAVSRVGWAAFLRLTVPFGALGAAAMLGGSPEYRYNLGEVPRIFGWLPEQSFLLLAQAVCLNLFFFAFAACGLRDAAREWRATSTRRQALAFVTLPPLAMGVLQLALRGSSTNNMLEGFIMVALLGSATWISLESRVVAGRSALVSCVLVAAMVPLPVMQLAGAARGITYQAVRGVSVGNLIKLNAAQLDQRRRFADWLATLPKPLWTRDAMYQMPWFATDNAFPAFVLNHQFETDAKAKKIFEGEGFADWISRRHFAALVLDSDDWLAAVARRAGYVEAPFPPGFEVLPSEFGIDGGAPHLLLRPDVVRP